MELGYWYHALGRHSKCGVGFSAAGQTCFGQLSLFALLVLMLKAESFLALSLTPQSRVTEGQSFRCYCLSVVPKFTVGYEDQLSPPYMTFLYNFNAEHHHLTAHPVRPREREDLQLQDAPLWCIVLGSSRRVQQRLQR